MGKSVLIVEVIDTETNRCQEYTFDRAPIRLGRSPLNDLPLDRSFVSHCHGVLQFDALHCEFVDLGSTNGSFLGGERMPKNQSVKLTPSSVLTIGALTLRVRHATTSRVETRASYAFGASDLNRASLRPGLASRPAPAAPPAPPAPATASTAPAFSATAALEALAPVYAQYRTQWRAFFTVLTQQAPAETDRAAIADELLRRFPELMQEAEFRHWLGTEGPPSLPSTRQPTDFPAVLAAALGVTLSPETQGAFVHRAGQVLERFALAFVELRRGQRQVVRDLSVPMPTGEALDTIEDARAILLHLLDPTAPAGRVDELSRAYADVMLHQVALLNGMMAGARALLAELSPAALSAGDASGPAGWLSRALGGDARWAEFSKRFGDLEEESALSAVFLGQGFARAYAAAMGHTSSAEGGQSEPRAYESTGRL